MSQRREFNDVSEILDINSEDSVYFDDTEPDEDPGPYRSSSRRTPSVKEKIAAIERQKWEDAQQLYNLAPLRIAMEEREDNLSYSIDPFEYCGDVRERSELEQLSPGFLPGSPTEGVSIQESHVNDSTDEDALVPAKRKLQRTTFLLPKDIHPNMENKEEEIQRLRLLAGKLSSDWGHADFMAPALARRIRDFQFAQEKRRKKYGDERPWGILGLYDHLSSIRIDVEWAEDAASRRANGNSYLSWADFDENKKGGSNRPYFTYVLLFLCTAVMIASIAVNDWTIEPIDENPMVGPSAETLILMGAKESSLIVLDKEGWRLLTSSVLHAGLVHFFVNMLALWFVGAAVEMSHGWMAALTIFSLSAVGGSILSALFLPEAISVGASGGIFGFIGACLADIIMNWRLLFCDFVTGNGKKHHHIIVVVVLFLDIALNSIIGLTPFVDNYNHLGGMLYGFLCGLTTIERLSADFFGMEEGVMVQAKQFFVRFFGVILSLASIVTTLVVLLNGDATKTPCPSCTWLSCVPFPPWAPNQDKWWYCDACGRVTADVVSAPTFHLELHCPSGAVAHMELDPDESKFDREKTQKELPQYCRKLCPLFDAELN